jgi:hypothetical protein
LHAKWVSFLSCGSSISRIPRPRRGRKNSVVVVVVVVGEGGNPSVALTSGTWPIRAIGLLLVIQFL